MNGAAVVREYRDQVANAVFLPDVLLRGDLVKLLERLSAHGRQRHNPGRGDAPSGA